MNDTINKMVRKVDGSTEPYSREKLTAAIRKDAEGLNLNIGTLIDRIEIALHDGATTDQIRRMVTLEANSLLKATEPDWSRLAARTTMQGINREVTGRIMWYPTLRSSITRGVEQSNLDPRLLELFEPHFDMLDAVIEPAADMNFDYLGIQTVYDRYLLRDRVSNKVIELPQHWFMRVAMGHAIHAMQKGEVYCLALVVALYREYSSHRGLSSTPTLFNSGTTHPQLSSCFILNVPDSTSGIMDTMKECAKYSKHAGGIGMSFSRIRASGSRIQSTNGRAGGPVRYMRIGQEVLRGFDQSGKRKGSGAFWMVAHHPQFLDHLSLWNKSGDESERTHYVFPANWIPSLLMERWKEARDNAAAIEAGTYEAPKWSFFCPSVAPELMDLHGDEYTRRYQELEAEGKFDSQMLAFDVVSKMLNAWYQHGVFWTGFKDHINLRYPMRDAYSVDSSNLCTEIVGRSSESITTVCNLASPNLSKFDFKIESAPGQPMRLAWCPELHITVQVFIKALDAVIDNGWVPDEKGQNFNNLERMIGLGEMGLTECMAKHGIRYDSKEGVCFSNEVKRQMAISALWTSVELAMQFGPFPDFKNSMWARGELPMDNAFTKVKRRLHGELGIRFDYDSPLGSEVALREAIIKYGVRNSAMLATAPTATISNILGTTACRELPFEDVTLKQNLSGDFETFAPTLRHDLNYPLAYNVDPIWTIYHTAVAQLWTDQAISTNIYLRAELATGEKMMQIFELAYDLCLKTLYYLYSQSPDSTAVNRALRSEASNMQGGQLPFDAEQATPGAWDCEGCM